MSALHKCIQVWRDVVISYIDPFNKQEFYDLWITVGMNGSKYAIVPLNHKTTLQSQGLGVCDQVAGARDKSWLISFVCKPFSFAT